MDFEAIVKEQLKNGNVIHFDGKKYNDSEKKEIFDAIYSVINDDEFAVAGYELRLANCQFDVESSCADVFIKMICTAARKGMVFAERELCLDCKKAHKYHCEITTAYRKLNKEIKKEREKINANNNEKPKIKKDKLKALNIRRRAREKAWNSAGEEITKWEEKIITHFNKTTQNLATTVEDGNAATATSENEEKVNVGNFSKPQNNLPSGTLKEQSKKVSGTQYSPSNRP